MHLMSVVRQPVDLILEIAAVPCVSVSEHFEEDIGGVISHVQHIEEHPGNFVQRLGAR